MESLRAVTMPVVARPMKKNIINNLNGERQTSSIFVFGCYPLCLKGCMEFRPAAHSLSENASEVE